MSRSMSHGPRGHEAPSPPCANPARSLDIIPVIVPGEAPTFAVTFLIISRYRIHPSMLLVILVSGSAGSLGPTPQKSPCPAVAMVLHAS